MPALHSRRDFIGATTMAGFSAMLSPACSQDAATPKTIKLRKAVKVGMIATGKTFQEKFELIKNIGFEGVEMDSPSPANRDEAKEAAAKTGIIIHGVVDSIHWKERLSDPDGAVRERGLAGLKTAIQDAAFYGATTVLLVPGKVGPKESYDEVWSRSQEEIKKVLTLAEESKVKIAIEVVWNNFITKPEQLVQYVDSFQSPWVGAYFDASNMLKYGVSSADWIRALDKRLLKFDFKGYSIAKAKEAGEDYAGFKVGIGEGDENWPEVMKALADVAYAGEWATAEVGGGDEAKLRDIYQRMEKIFNVSA